MESPQPANSRGGEETCDDPVSSPARERASSVPLEDSPCEDSSSEDEANAVHAKRLGVDYSLDSEEEELTFQSARIFRIENLERLRKLRKLCLIANEISVIEGLEAQASCLVHLELYQNHISRMDHVDILIHLKVLDLSFNSIRRIENLGPLVHLEELFLSSNKISKMEGLDTLTRLRMLELGSNRIRQIEGIENLKELRSLWLGKNKISRLKLPPLPLLEKLSVQSNRLQEWEPQVFARCPSLQELYLSHNCLPSPPRELAAMKCLVLLDIGANRLDNLEAVAELPLLQDLWVNDNALASLDDCRCLRKLPSLQTVYLERNPLQANLGPSYRQKMAEMLSQLVQLDATLLRTSLHVIQRDDPKKVKPIMKH